MSDYSKTNGLLLPMIRVSPHTSKYLPLLRGESRVYLEIHRSLTRESKRLEQEAKKLNVNRASAESGSNGSKFLETDESLIYRMYCAWFNITPIRMDFWDMGGIYKTVHRTNVTMQDGVII